MINCGTGRQVKNNPLSDEEIFLNVLEGRKYAVIERKSEMIIKEWISFDEALQMIAGESLVSNHLKDLFVWQYGGWKLWRVEYGH